MLAFHAHNRAAVAIAVGLEALNLPLLLVFVTGLHGLVGRRGGAGADWSRLAVAAGATLSAVMAFYAVLWDGVVLSAGELTEPSPVLELAWHMHAAAFAWSLPALGTTFIGAALATHASGLTPPWQRLLGVAGGGLLLAAGAANLAIADGSALVFVGAARLRRLARLAACDRRTAGPARRTADRPQTTNRLRPEEERMTTGMKAAAIAAALGAFAGGAIADAALGLEVSGTTAEHVGEVAFRNGLL